MATVVGGPAPASPVDERADLLRVATAGSVDDGKSTLIGRLLLDAKGLLADQLEHVERVSRERGHAGVDLALLTDGLRAEREQGITIDVAYRPFATPRRRFILADTPGHVQYTRNMVTGASTADAAVILVDARHGVVEQTRRHAHLSALLGVGHIMVCINKMDLVGFDQEVFDAIAADVAALGALIEVPDIAVIPVSALEGDNVVELSERTPWYDGPPLLGHLEEVPAVREAAGSPARFPVQWVIPPAGAEGRDDRGYAGQMAGGTLHQDDEVVVLPSGLRTRIARIDSYDGSPAAVTTPQSATLLLADQLDVSRGDLICATSGDAPAVVRELEATVCWFAEKPLVAGARLALKHTTRGARAIVDELTYRTDVGTLAREPEPAELGLNDVGGCASGSTSRSPSIPTRPIARRAPSYSSTRPRTRPSAPGWWTSRGDRLPRGALYRGPDDERRGPFANSKVIPPVCRR
jgi:sulfate adenylyltransferase large subunit